MAEVTTAYNGPTVHIMLQTHTLAQEIITRAPGPQSQRIFDDAALSLLHRWCSDPSTAATTQLLEEQTAVDGKSGEESGSLVRFLMAKAVKGEDLVTDEEMKELREWFGNHDLNEDGT